LKVKLIIIEAKSSILKNSKSPAYTQKFFSPDNLYQNMSGNEYNPVEIVGKNLFSGINEAQGGGYIEDRDSIIDRSNSKLNSTKDSFNTSFPLGGPTDKASSLPIFKLLQAFRLQQYAKTFLDLGYGFEVYKIALLLPRQRHDLLNKLNLMPGHRARFLSLFEIIDQIYPKEEKFKILQDFKKSTKSKPILASNPNPRNSAEPKENSNKPGKKRRSLMRCYNSLDKQAKKDINENFIKRIKENKSTAYLNNAFNIQNVISKHVSHSKTRKAIKSIFPPSMYDKYDNCGGSKYRSKSNKNREGSAMKDQKIQNVIRKNRLPPLPEIAAGKGNYIPKSKKNDTMEFRRGSTGLGHQKVNSMSHKKISRSGARRNEDMQVNAMSATKYPVYQNNRKIYSGGRQRASSGNKMNHQRKPKSLNREEHSIYHTQKQRSSRDVIKRNKKSKSKSKSGSKRRSKNKSRDGVLSTSAASNAGRLISSASTSEKRSVKPTCHPPRLEKIIEKPKRVPKNFTKPIIQSKSNQNTAKKSSRNNFTK
jgi:hypothetical protein